MTQEDRQSLEKQWLVISQKKFDELLQRMIEQFEKEEKKDWFASHSEVLLDPLCHSQWRGLVRDHNANLMPFRMAHVRGKKMYVFKSHIDELLAPSEN